MVMPRSRSMSIRSRYCARMARSSTTPVSWSIRSARVDLPWSMWAMMQKLRSSSGGVAAGVMRAVCAALGIGDNVLLVRVVGAGRAAHIVPRAGTEGRTAGDARGRSWPGDTRPPRGARRRPAPVRGRARDRRPGGAGRVLRAVAGRRPGPAPGRRALVGRRDGARRRPRPARAVRAAPDARAGRVLHLGRGAPALDARRGRPGRPGDSPWSARAPRPSGDAASCTRPRCTCGT